MFEAYNDFFTELGNQNLYSYRIMGKNGDKNIVEKRDRDFANDLSYYVM